MALFFLERKKKKEKEKQRVTQRKLGEALKTRRRKDSSVVRVG